MARVKDLWFSEVRDPSDPTKKVKRKTKRHPDNGGSKEAKRWLAVWIGPDGKEATKAFLIKDRAKNYARDMESDVDRGEYIDPKAGRELFGPLARKYLRLRDVGATSRSKYERVIRLHISPTFDHRQVGSIKPSECGEWMRKLADTHGRSIQEQALTLLRGIFELAVADGLRKDNPAKSSVVPEPRDRDGGGEEREPWNSDRVWAVISVHPEPYRTIPTVSGGCGLREGEAFALALEDFDFEAGKVTIRRQITREGKTWVFKLPKGGKTRTVPLPNGVARAVKAYIDTYPPHAYTLPWLREDGKLEGEHTCALLFRWWGRDSRTNDQHIRASSYDQVVWKPALAAAGVIPEPEPGPRGGTYRRFTQGRHDATHALRHFYSATLQDAGVSLAGVMDFLGHSRKGRKGLPVTLNTYGHTTEVTFETARNAIDRTLFRLRAVQDHSRDGTGTEQAAS
ncbi:tyrosine-type recombinase/integrase [Actinomadura harenae]|uniref:Tyr recombinase domain-containing protein n=1 Tax=Actinomadura harenae TaxID=2483351 RepID=A0A3M2M784_9ACTN|nr:tyrosine-type recombinase/integrase [Actinomadura harenae]RMI44713.1 hypothetical protein EBO15_12230 [Actinomadura harenae]